MRDVVFTRVDDRLGMFAVRPVDLAADLAMLHSWVTHPKAAYWLMQGASAADVEKEYHDIAARQGHDAFIGLHEGQPVFLTERYNPACSHLATVYTPRPGDVGMHFLVAPTDRPIHGFTLAVITTVMEMLFADARVHRVVVEPDVRNTAVHALNAAVGFTVERSICLPGKNALLSTCTRDQYRTSRGEG